MRVNLRGSVVCGCALAGLGFCVSAVRADLLVTPEDNGSTSPVVFRFDDHTGALINEFGEESEGYEGMAVGPDEKIYITSNILGYGDVFRFDRQGKYLGSFHAASLRTPGALVVGPDGNCYVIGSNWPQNPTVWQIWRYNRTTGAFMDIFVANAGSPTHLAFGQDHNLYVADANRGIVRYNGTTAASVDTFVPLGRGGVSDMGAFLFGPDGNLYVASSGSNAVVRFNGATGQFINYFVAPGGGGLDGPGGLAFGADGNLYVSSTANHRILRFDGRTGAFKDIFAAHPDLRYPTSLAFTPPLPRLQLKHVSSQVQISWPSSSSPQNWQLFKRQNAGASANWVGVTNGFALSGTNCVVTDSPAGTCVMYRLEQQ